MSKPEDVKKAVILRDNQVVGVLEGAQAEEAIAQAEAAGLEVRQDAEEVKKLINPTAGNSRVPEELYLLMSTIIEFAQELDEQWEQGLETWDIEEVVDD